MLFQFVILRFLQHNIYAKILSYLTRKFYWAKCYVCVKLFSVPFSPQYFWHSIFVRFFLLPRECLRLVPWHFKLRSKDQEPNLKCQDDYLKLLASFPMADE